MTTHVRKPSLVAVVVKGQLLMVEAQQVKDCGMKIVNCANIMHGPAPKVVCSSETSAAFYSSSQHPDGEAVCIVIPSDGSLLTGGHAPKLRGPKDQRLIEKSS